LLALRDLVRRAGGGVQPLLRAYFQGTYKGKSHTIGLPPSEKYAVPFQPPTPSPRCASRTGACCPGTIHGTEALEIPLRTAMTPESGLFVPLRLRLSRSVSAE
jgi:hypothetical protein